MNHYNAPDAPGKPSRPPTPLERHIADVHGEEAHELIYEMKQLGMTDKEIAAALSDKERGLSVSRTKVNSILNAHYVREEVWKPRS